MAQGKRCKHCRQVTTGSDNKSQLRVASQISYKLKVVRNIAKSWEKIIINTLPAAPCVCKASHKTYNPNNCTSETISNILYAVI